MAVMVAVIWPSFFTPLQRIKANLRLYNLFLHDLFERIARRSLLTLKIKNSHRCHLGHGNIYIRLDTICIRGTMKRKLMGALLLCLCIGFGNAQEEMPNLDNVEIITRHISGNVYMLEATGDVAGNIAVSAGPDGLLLVDTQFAPLAPKIRQALKKIQPGQIKYIINTHHHDDHTHGNSALGASATIIAHDNTRKRLKTMQRTLLPHITFKDRLSIYFNGEEIDIIHYPKGHSDSDVVVYFRKSNVVHTGDLWNSGIWSFPFVDLDAGGTIYGMLRNVKRIIDSVPEDATIIPGHYAASDLSDLRRTHNMLIATIGIVRSKKAKGLSLEQIKREGFPPKYDAWGTAYTNAAAWIENIYLGLSVHNGGKHFLNLDDRHIKGSDW